MGTLYLIATPVGNLRDITLRALETLKSVDALACEDTRHTGNLLKHFDIPRPAVVFAYHERNESRAVDRILALLRDGQRVGVCSKAGYPGVSDPGFLAVSEALEAGHEIEVIPGASAVPLALLQSGLPSSSYAFRGFSPRKEGKRRTFIGLGRELPHTLIFYESPARLGKFLSSALAALGDRRAAVCLELTKKFERVERGFLSELAAKFAEKRPKGEATVVIAGNHPKLVRPSEERPSQSKLRPRPD